MFFTQPLKTVQTILSMKGVQTWAAGRVWPGAAGGETPVMGSRDGLHPWWPSPLAQLWAWREDRMWCGHPQGHRGCERNLHLDIREEKVLLSPQRALCVVSAKKLRPGDK